MRIRDLKPRRKVQAPAAGCILRARDTGRLGLQQRSDTVNDPGVWSTWGGGRRANESLEDCVRRELKEESGYGGPVDLTVLLSTPEYVTFIADVPAEFVPLPRSEVKDYCWIEPGEWPQPLHQAMIPALQKLTGSAALTEARHSIRDQILHAADIHGGDFDDYFVRFTDQDRLGYSQQQRFGRTLDVDDPGFDLDTVSAHPQGRRVLWFYPLRWYLKSQAETYGVDQPYAWLVKIRPHAWLQTVRRGDNQVQAAPPGKQRVGMMRMSTPPAAMFFEPAFDVVGKFYDHAGQHRSHGQRQGMAEGEINDTAITLTRLGKFHPGADPLAEFVPERATSQYALHPDKWESTFYSLTLKDSYKLRYYGPKKIPIPPGTLVGDMAIANKFYTAETPEEEQKYAEEYRQSLKPYPVDVSKYRMPELLIPRQGVAEDVPQPGPSSGAPKQFGADAEIQTRQMTVKDIISSVPGVPYYNNVVDDWDDKDYSWNVTQKVIEYATYLKDHPESLAKLPPAIVLNGKFEDGAHRVSAIWLLQQRMDPKNPLWKNAKLNVQFVKQGVAEGQAQQSIFEPADVDNKVVNFYSKDVGKFSTKPINDFDSKAAELISQAPVSAKDKVAKILAKAKTNPYIQGGVVTTIGALLTGGLLTMAQRMNLSPQQTNLLLQAILNTVIPTIVSRVNGRNWKDTIKYTLASAGIGTGIAAIAENSADGKKPGRRGSSRRVGKEPRPQHMRLYEFIDETAIKLSSSSDKAKAWIKKVYDLYPQTWQNNHVMPIGGQGDDQQFAMFELVPSLSKRGAVEIKWFQAYPLRQGVGSRAMKELQRLAQEDGIALTLYPWDKGQVSQSKLIKFYRGAGFTPTAKGAKNMSWDPVNENFADGKKPGRQGLSRRVGIPRKASLGQLAKIAANSTGERRRMAQWQLNMRRGKKRKAKQSESIHALPIVEALSAKVYHYTNVIAARDILSSNQFELSSTLGSVEQSYAPRGYPYFLSTTRTRRGGYHDIVGSSGVLFELDGNYYNQRYPAQPVDYWGNRDPAQSHHRKHEAEDRIFSAEPTIPANGVLAMHVLVKPDADPHVKAWARQAFIQAKKRGIKAVLYDNADAWRNFDIRQQVSPSTLRGQERTGGYVSTHPGYLMPWIELISARSQSQLSKRANDIRYSLQYNQYRVKDMVQGLNTDLSNARKPNSGPDREHAVKIIQYMRANRLASVADLVQYLADKWATEK